MAIPGPPAICSLPAYQALAGFPPALGYCSSVSFLDERKHQSDASLYATRDVPCPVGYDSLCDLLSELKASGPDFARGACCCIGVCVGTRPTAFVTVSVTNPTTVSSIQTSSLSSSTTSIADSDTVTSSSSSSSSITSTTSPTISSIPSSTVTSASGTSSSSQSSTSLSSSSASSTVASTSTSASPSSTSISTSSSSSSSSSSTTAYCPTANPTCTAITPAGGVSVTYDEYYSGQQYIEDLNNPGNDDTSFPPIYNSLPGTLDMCDAATNCAEIADSTTSTSITVYGSFDLHYLTSNGTWECVLYYDPNTDPSYFDVADSDACISFGFSQSESDIE